MTHGFDIRERLGFMREHPTNCAITREGFLVQAITWRYVKNWPNHDDFEAHLKWLDVHVWPLIPKDDQ